MSAFTIPAGTDLRDTWQWKLLVATEGRASHLITRAMFHNNGSHYPRMAYSAVIDKEGYVTCDMALTADQADWYHKVPVDHVIKVRDGFRRIADELKLNDKDRTELFEVLASWMATDLRAKSGIEGSDT